ncbi:MAG: YihY family inner membrane protein [Pseudonocardiaceae bacterium]|nr:YihY family inner membrane protein [Pseudonocardiaceae bacterium]
MASKSELDSPSDLSPRGWWQIVKRGFQASMADNAPMLAAGLAFFAFLAVFPTLIAAITLYGLVADPERVAEQVWESTSILPGSARQLIAEQLTEAISGDGAALTIGLIVSLLAVLWSASSGVSNLIKAVNLAYTGKSARGFGKRRAIALWLTLAAILFMIATLTLVAVLPPVIADFELGFVGRILAEIVRWTLLVGLVVVSLATIYRVAPERHPRPEFRWLSVGVVFATVLWIGGSLGFSLYIELFGNYNRTYGTLAGVIVFMLWLLLTSYVVLLGAEINAEAEREADQTTPRHR